jgi:hypothetical protein
MLSSSSNKHSSPFWRNKKYSKIRLVISRGILTVKTLIIKFNVMDWQTANTSEGSMIEQISANFSSNKALTLS